MCDGTHFVHITNRMCVCIHDVILQAGIVNLSFKTTVDDIELSDSRRVDCVLFRCIHYVTQYWRLACFVLHVMGIPKLYSSEQFI